MSIGAQDVQPCTRAQSLRSLLPVAKLLIGLVVLGFISAACLELGRNVTGSVSQINWVLMSVALGVAIGYRVLNASAWGLVLSSLSLKLPTRLATRIRSLSEACRWLPGGVWNLGSRAALASRAGLPATVVGASLGLELIITIASWTLLALVGLAPHPESLHLLLDRLTGPGIGPLGTIGLGAVIVLGFLLAIASRSPRLVSKIKGAINRLRAAIRLRPRAMPMGAAFASYTLLGAMNGLAFLAVIHAVAPKSGVPPMVAVGVNASAWLIGFFAVFAPGGLIVREGAAAADSSPGCHLSKACSWRHSGDWCRLSANWPASPP